MTVIDGLLAFAGIFSFFMSQKSLEKILLFLVSFATGTLLGGAFFHLLPEAYNKLPIILIIAFAFLGFILFFFIEKILHWHYCKDEKCRKHIHPFTYLTLAGNAVHNFIDGLIIATSFIVSIPLGIITSLLIIAHELPHEIGNFSVLVYGGFSRIKALVYNFLIQLTAVLGGILGFYFISLKEEAVFLLPFAAGGFIYIAFVDLMPEIFKEKKKIKLIINIIAIILGLLLLISSRFIIG